MKVIICYAFDNQGLPVFEYGFSEESQLISDFKEENKGVVIFSVETEKEDFMADDAYEKVIEHIENKS